jgi:hypothetical protein
MRETISEKIDSEVSVGLTTINTPEPAEYPLKLNKQKTTLTGDSQSPKKEIQVF